MAVDLQTNQSEAGADKDEAAGFHNVLNSSMNHKALLKSLQVTVGKELVQSM